MSEPKIGTVWRCIDIKGQELPDNLDCVSITLQANGKLYCVAVSGPRGMRSGEGVGALEAALGHIMAAYGIDPSKYITNMEATTETETKGKLH